MTAGGAVSHFSLLPPNHKMSLSMTTATPFILFPQLEALFLAIHLKDI